MHQLGYAHHRQSDLDLALAGLHLFEDFPHAVPSAFGSDDHAGIKDYSHVGGFHISRFLMISSMSAAKSASIVGTCPVSSSCFLASAMHSEMVRRGGAGAWITATGSW